MADPKTDKQIEAEAHVDTLVRRGLKALEQFRELNQEQVDYIVAKASVAALDQHGVLAKHAHEETRRGVFEDKATKNLFACEHVVNNMRHTKTVGVINEDEVTGLTLIAEPVGVVCGITPTTNPTSTAIFKSLIALKTRNPIVFAFHPSAQESSKHAAQIVYDAAVAAGAPKNCIQWIEKPSMEATQALMNHDGIATILATGGNAMVRAAYSCGGGSVMDAAKVMWMFYEQPQIDFRDLVQKFMDIRKRAFKFPELGEKAKYVGIPTTSGTGSEVTPFAVISDKQHNRKYPLADYSLTPTVAIVDPAFVMTVPQHVVADTGMDVLTHAVEAYVSTLANDYTDGLALQAIKIVFQYLESSVKNADFESREKMHNASTMAGMAFANAFLGISHSMAHKIGGYFHTVHGRTNAILLPYVIRYNGTRPAKTATWPKYNYYHADEKYQDIARLLGLPAATPEEAVSAFAQAVYELGERVGIKMSFRDQGIDEKTWMAAAEEIAYLAYEDQCSPANPRLAMVSDMKEILEDAYYGYKTRPGRIK